MNTALGPSFRRPLSSRNKGLLPGGVATFLGGVLRATDCGLGGQKVLQGINGHYPFLVHFGKVLVEVIHCYLVGLKSRASARSTLRSLIARSGTTIEEFLKAL